MLTKCNGGGGLGLCICRGRRRTRNARESKRDKGEQRDKVGVLWCSSENMARVGGGAFGENERMVRERENDRREFQKIKERGHVAEGEVGCGVPRDRN